jgi:cephalosporin hydroxylase
MNALDSLASKYGTDKVHHHNYVHFYDVRFNQWRNKPINLLEIGVQEGFSIQMWLEYFPKAKIYGVDIDDCKAPVHPSYVFVRGDQSKSEFWESFLRQHSQLWDVVIDDGSHRSDGIITSFNHLWPKVQMGGYYCIEDLFCAYRPQYQVAGWPTSMEFIASLLKDINHGQKRIVSMEFSHELAMLLKG